MCSAPLRGVAFDSALDKRGLLFPTRARPRSIKHLFCRPPDLRSQLSVLGESRIRTTGSRDKASPWDVLPTIHLTNHKIARPPFRRTSHRSPPPTSPISIRQPLLPRLPRPLSTGRPRPSCPWTGASQLLLEICLRCCQQRCRSLLVAHVHYRPMRCKMVADGPPSPASSSARRVKSR